MTLPTRTHRSVAASLCAALLVPAPAHASFLPPELMDKAAFYLAWFIIVALPIAGIVLFWLVHILPEKIAHKRHHPQKDAIQTLCLLSLAFGGLLWPAAWLWAYTKPVSYRQAYGTDKGEEYFIEMAAKAEAGEVPVQDLQYLRDEIDAMAARGAISIGLRQANAKFDAALRSAAGAAVPATTVPGAAGAA